MKKILYLLLPVCLMASVACEKESVSVTDAEFPGTSWKLVKREGAAQYLALYTPLGEILRFEKGGKFSESNYNIVRNGTFTIERTTNGNDLILTRTYVNEQSPQQVSIVRDSIRVTEKKMIIFSQDNMQTMPQSEYDRVE